MMSVGAVWPETWRGETRGKDPEWPKRLDSVWTQKERYCEWGNIDLFDTEKESPLKDEI